MININEIHERIERVLDEIDEIYSVLMDEFSNEDNNVSFQQIKEVDLLIERLSKKGLNIPVEITRMKLDLFSKYENNAQISNVIDLLNSGLKLLLNKNFSTSIKKKMNQENDPCVTPNAPNFVENNDTNSIKEQGSFVLHRNNTCDSFSKINNNPSNTGYKIIKFGMHLLKQTNGNISNSDAVIEMQNAFPEKSINSLKSEIGKIRQNYNHIVGNNKSSKGVVYQIICQLRTGETASAGNSHTTNRYSKLAWKAFHEV